MPNSNNYSLVLEQLKHLDDAALEAIVRADQVNDGEASDIAIAAAMLLSQRAPQEIDPEASWNRFFRENLEQVTQESPVPMRKRKARSLRIAACIAAVLVIGCVTVFASDVGEYFAKWTQGALTFGTVQNGEPEREKIWPELTGDEPLEFDSLQEALDAYHVTEIKAPALPDSLTPVFVVVTDTPSWFDFDAMYEDEYHKLGISFISYADSPKVQFHAEGDTIEQREYKGHIYYIMRNLNTNKIVWLTSHFECNIEGNYTYDDLIKMFESIYD